jgi:signal transduction histidine kinase
MTEVIPYSLVAALVVGFAFGLRWKSVLAVLAMWIAWFLALIPDITQKFGSDLLGFVLWFAVGLYVSTLMRSLAAHTAVAAAERRAFERQLEAAQHNLEMARHRDEVRRGLHDGVLSILDGLARDRRLEMTARRSAQLGAIQARNMLRASNTSGTAFEARLSELAATFLGLQLLVRPRFYIHEEPPAHVADTVLAAASEALNNALKYAGDEVEVTFFAESGDGNLEISVLDHGVGFDMDTGPRGGGLTTSFESVKMIGGECAVTSAPGEGTQVVIRWPGNADAG